MAKKHREKIDGFRLHDAGLTREDWLAVVGVNATTRVALRIEKDSKGPVFNLTSKDRDNKWQDEDQAQRRLTGDGTVPLEGAVPKFLQEDNLVCVSPEDYGYWEIQDRALTMASGYHGILPNMNMLHRLIVRFFTGRPDPRRTTWGRRAPGVAKWCPPLELRETN
jgi:hypothetical protein